MWYSRLQTQDATLKTQDVRLKRQDYEITPPWATWGGLYEVTPPWATWGGLLTHPGAMEKVRLVLLN